MKFIIATRTSNKIIFFKKASNCVKINLIVHSFPKNSFIYQIAKKWFPVWPITCQTYILWKISSHLNNVYICRFCQTESCNTFSSQWWTGRCHDPSKLPPNWCQLGFCYVVLSLSSTPLQLSRTHYRFPHLTYAPASNPCSCIFLPLLKATALCYSILDCCTIVSVAPVTDPGAHIKSQNVTEPSHIWIFHSAKSQIYTHSQEPFGNKSGKVKLLLKYNVKLCDDIS